LWKLSKARIKNLLIKKDFKLIRVFEPQVTLKDKFSVIKTLFKNNISGTSPVVSEFEELSSKKFNRKYAVAVSNGSVALDIAFQSLKLNEEDEVILPSHTIISCLSAVIRSNAKPVFCDVDINTWNMTIEDIKKCVTPKTKVVLMVHTFGLPSEATAIEKYCSANGIILIEDAAEAHGQVEGSKVCGSFGDISTFSFYANKHITTGEGGLVVTDSKEIFNSLKQMRNLDFKNTNRFKHENLYWNYRISGLQAALGISQISNVERVIAKKRKQGLNYQRLLSEYARYITLPLDVTKNKLENHYWVFGVLLKDEGIRDQLINNLYQDGIETRPFFWPLHLQPALKNKDKTISLPNSEKLGNDGLYLPLGNHINYSDQKKIVEKLISNIEKLKGSFFTE
jgi:perosamine synthetase